MNARFMPVGVRQEQNRSDVSTASPGALRPLERPARTAISTSQTRIEILAAAAECFKEQGFAATSIDDVARRLSATKGMIYHHFRSKTDLFFDVYRRGMEINFAAIEPHVNQSGPALQRLYDMGMAHAITMMAEQAFQRTQTQGVAMHLTGSTTAAQRDVLNELIDLRDQYETAFRNAIEQAIVENGLPVSDSSLAVKSFLAVLNATVFWYRPSNENTEDEHIKLANEVVTFALRGIGADPATIIQGVKT